MSTAMPQVPPRPTRTHDQKSSVASSLGGDLPKIPPRPANRRHDRSISPQRESFAPSPLNEAPPPSNHGNQSKSSLYKSESANASTSELPRRPSSVTLPTLGQEGSEYAEVFAAPEDLSSSPTQTRNVADDLKLHAPRPSLPTSSAKQRVSAVTRTDSGQAAAFGIGKASSDDKDPSSRPLKAKASFASQTSNGPERPASSLESEHGIPEIGQRVPMYPNAGDVQAPSPSPYQTAFAPGIGFHNDGSKPRNHTRKSSGRGTDIPFDAYGKHGHGQLPHDRFEKAYYEKHPELLKKETGHYHGPFAEDRPEWAMSSDDLNKIVRDTASRGAGIGTSPAIMGTPSEQIGFQASEEYTSRMSSPRPLSWALHAAQSSTSQAHVDSPLRKESSAGHIERKEYFEGALSKKLEGRLDAGPESEIEDEDTIHVDAPARRISKIYGGVGHLDSTEDLGPGSGGGEDGIHDEHGYGAPILASDEVAKEPFTWELQPAVSPLNESRSSAYDDYNLPPRSGSASSSRTPSRPGSVHGGLPGIRLPSDRPLEALEEYEPLFSEETEEDEGDAPNKRPLTAADKLKRPKNRKFPSRDIWEDTPNSLQYTATVSTPQLPEDKEEDARLKPVGPGETPEQAFARKQEELAEKEAEESDSFLTREHQPWPHNPHAVSESRFGMKQRFPSRDIWEDSPDSLQLHATVSEPQGEGKDALAPPSERPTTGAVAYHQEKAAAGLPLGSEEGRATTGIAATTKPIIPARPGRAKSAESPEKTQPVVPARPSDKLRQGDGASPPLPVKTKPQVPARPSKPVTRNSSENVSLAKIPSNSSAKSSGSDQGVVAKPKPPVPSRPVGSKIAALQSGFMMDLNKRLQLGPQAPKKEEPAPEEVEEEKEKAPLVDARKGRARGPARRAPANVPVPATSEAAAEKPKVTCAFCLPSTLWHIDPDEDLLVPSQQEEVSSSPKTELSPSERQALTTNIAEQDSPDKSEIGLGAENPASQASVVEEGHAEQSAEGLNDGLTESSKEPVSTDVHDNAPTIEPSEEAPVVSEDNLQPDSAGEGLLALKDTFKPTTEDIVE